MWGVGRLALGGEGISGIVGNKRIKQPCWSAYAHKGHLSVRLWKKKKNTERENKEINKI
jgi:hypothetical protein